MLEQYAPKNVVMSCYGFDITGFSEDAMIDVSWSTDNFNTEVGLGGEGFVSRTGSSAGTITITLLPNSKANSIFETLYLLNEVVYNSLEDDDELKSYLLQGIRIQNNNNGNSIIAPTAYLTSMSDIMYGKESNVRVWTFVCPRISLIPSSGVGKLANVLAKLEI